MRQLADFSGRVVLVGGCAAGIGRATALAFARAGAQLVLADIDAPRGEALAREIAGFASAPLFHQVDLTDPDGVAALFGRIADRFGRLDCAHNNAGFGWGTGLLDCSLDDWQRTMALCLTAPFLCLQHEIALMRARGGGAIVNTASMAALRHAPAANAAYTAAKAGIIALTRYAAVTHASEGIRVNAVSPGLVSTEAVAKFMSDEQQIAYARAEQAIGRPVATDEVADAVLWLCSDGSRMITGENLCIAGGQQAI